MPKKTIVKAFEKPRSTRWKALGAAVASAVMLVQAQAAGLGQLTVLSALGQPLQAEIELTSVSREEAGSLAVKLASPEAFRQANIEFNPALLNLRFAIEQRGGRQVVKISSPQPISEPFVDLLLEVNSQGNRLVREYVVLLDPVGSRRIQSAESTPSAPAASAAPAAAASQPRQNRAAGAPAARQENAAADTYAAVKRGDTLASIAGQVKPQGVSLDQMLVAMQRANPNAFVGNNMNRLRSGQILTVPPADAARSVNSAEARRIIVAQSADFNNYRNRLASQVAGVGTGQADEGRQIASGHITAKVEEQKNPAGESRDRLQVSRSGAAPGEADTEERIAREKALSEANARVRELEKTVNDLQKLLEIRNRDLAARQNAGANPAPPAASGPEANTAAANSQAATPPLAAAPSDPASSAAAPAPAAAPTPAAATPPSDKTAAANKPKPTAVLTPAPTPGFFENVSDSPAMLGGGALVLALLAGLGISRSRAGKKARIVSAPAPQAPAAPKTNSLFGEPGGQSVDTSNSVFNSSFSPSASQLDTNEVDPVAEADVYIAYGRDTQAEEILKEALRTQPDRAAVRGKLLEIYANRKDLRAFEATAAELHAMTRGEGEEWQQAATLGATLDPSNPLYASGKKPADAQLASPAAALLAGAAGIAGAGAAGAAAAATALHHQEKTEEEDELDFDSLLNTTRGPVERQREMPQADAPEQAETAASIEEPFTAAPEAENPPTAEVVPAEEDAPAAPETVDEESGAENGNLLNFDFDLSSFGKNQPAAPLPQGSPTPQAEDAHENLMDFEPDQPQAKQEHAAPQHEEVEDEFSPLELDLPGKSGKASHEASHPSPADFDLSGISLELEPATADGAALHDVPVLGEHNYSNAAEMATKLDLASAYQEIGDREGARELLEEVIKGGTAEQSDKAKVLLQKLD